MTWREIASDVLIVAGIAGAGFGAWLAWAPLGFVAWGIGIAFVGWTLAVRPSARRRVGP